MEHTHKAILGSSVTIRSCHVPSFYCFCDVFAFFVPPALTFNWKMDMGLFAVRSDHCKSFR